MSAADVKATRGPVPELPGHDLEKQAPSNGTPTSADDTDGTDFSEKIAEAQPAKAPLGSKAGLTVSQFWIVLFGLNIGMLLTALDFNIVATAVPIISSDFGEYNNSSWLGTAFLITFALVLPIYAKLGDVFGRKVTFLFATAIFAGGSALCGWSQTMSMLIWSRAVQGLGAGGIYGLCNVILTDLVELQEVGKFLSITGAVWAIADVAGPLLGGVFAQYATWRWCFWINLIISPISFSIVWFTLNLPSKDSNLVQGLKNFDYLGAITMSGATVSLVLGLTWGGNIFEWDDSRVIGTLVGGFAMIVTFIVIEHYVKDPLVFPSMFKSRALLAIYAAEFVYGMTLLGCMYYVPQFFQLVFNDSAVLSGVGLLPMMLGIAVGNPIAAFVTSKYGLTLANAIVGGCFEVLATGLMTRWDASTSRAEAIILLIVLGVGQGAVLTGLLMSAQVAVEPSQIGVITGLAIFLQTVGDIFGIAVFATVYVNDLRGTLKDLGLDLDAIDRVLADPVVANSDFDGDLSRDIVESFATSLQNGWWLMFACAVALVVFSCLSRQHKFDKGV